MKKPTPIYHAHTIQNWEKRWFVNNSSYGLMQQAGLALAHSVIGLMDKHTIKCANITIWCGVGNNGGDGYLLGKYLHTLLDNRCVHIQIFAPSLPLSHDATLAKQELGAIMVVDKLSSTTHKFAHNIHIDALFGNGLNKELNPHYQALIHSFNEQTGLKVALDVPSGLHPDTGVPLPVCTTVDYTLCVMGLKMGLFSGTAKTHVGKVINLPLIPADKSLHPCAYLSKLPCLPQRNPTAHKGDFGSVAVVGGNYGMGGAVMMSASSAMAVGAGKVTVFCDGNYHGAMLAHLPSVMVADIEQFHNHIENFDAVCIGMGLGRDKSAEAIFLLLMQHLLNKKYQKPIVLDADALYFLAQLQDGWTFEDNWVGTPHASEAGRLLGVSADTINQDRLQAIYNLKQRYGGNWVLKGANTLSLSHNSDDVFVCPFGNAGMATAGMGDVLAGMMAGLLAQKSPPPMADIVSLHALAGDELSKSSPIISAVDMPTAIKHLLKTLTV